MILIGCLTCKIAVRIVGDYEQMEFLFGLQSDWYPDKYPCVTEGCSGKGQLFPAITPSALHRLTVTDLSPLEAFAALHGLGLPTERECSASAVQRAFQDSPVKKVEAQHIKGTDRCVVEHIELQDGKKIWFGASGYGAVVYRISAPHSYAEAAGG